VAACSHAKAQCKIHSPAHKAGSTVPVFGGWPVARTATRARHQDEFLADQLFDILASLDGVIDDREDARRQYLSKNRVP
jgi:hypothetical protein